MQENSANSTRSFIEGMHHVGFVVKEMDRSLAFYEKIGFSLQARWEEPAEECAEGLGIPEAHIELAQLRGHGFLLELISFVNPHPESACPPMNSIGAAHIAFKVTDVEAALKAFEQIGAFPVSPVQRFRGADWVQLHDPDGNRLELIKIWQGS